MGYKVGHGLGKHAQGRVDPIEMSKQRGRRGLGLHIQGLEAADLEWNSSLEVCNIFCICLNFTVLTNLYSCSQTSTKLFF